MPTTYTPSKAFLGIAPETTPGTAVAPTMTIPIAKGDFDDAPKFLDDPSLRGSMAALYGRYAGTKIANVGFQGPMYPDTFVHLLQNMLGDRTTTGASDPYTHAVSLNNSATGQPITHSLTYYTGMTPTVGARVYTGACLSDLAINYDAEAKLIEYTCKGMAWGSKIAAVLPVAAPSAVPPFAGWRALVGLAGPASGGTLVGTVSTLSIEFKRKLDAIYTFVNAQDPYVIQRGNLALDGKASFIATDEVPLTTMLANQQQQLQVKIDNGIVGAGQRALTVNCNLVGYKTVKANEGKTATMWDVTFDGIANSADAGATGGLSPCKLTVINGNPGTAY